MVQCPDSVIIVGPVVVLDHALGKVFGRSLDCRDNFFPTSEVSGDSGRKSAAGSMEIGQIESGMYELVERPMNRGAVNDID